nr:MAG TPA: hypothetical protein [Caudoviricetes sp.]
MRRVSPPLSLYIRVKQGIPFLTYTKQPARG